MSGRAVTEPPSGPGMWPWLDSPEGKVFLGLLVTSVFAVDTWSGSDVDLGPLYAMTVLLSCRATSFGVTVATVVASALLGGWSDHLLLEASTGGGGASGTAWIPWWNGLARLIVLATVAGAVRGLRWTLGRLDRSVHRLESTLYELEHTRVQLKTLEGMLPVCAWCGKIRDLDAEDRWVALQEYVREKSSASVTHGICPGCATKLERDLATSP